MGCCSSKDSEADFDSIPDTSNALAVVRSRDQGGMAAVSPKGEETAVSQALELLRLVLISEALTDSPVDRLARETGLDRDLVQKLYLLFTKVSTNGRMTPTNFIALFMALHEQTENVHLIKFLARLYLVFDTDSSGFIILEEFIKVLAIIIDGSAVDRMVLIFKLCDTDKNGEISRGEFLFTLENLAAFIPGEVNITGLMLMLMANAAFDKADLDGSGDVSPEEFVASLIVCDNEELGTLVRLIFSALVRIVTGDPPIPKIVKVIQITIQKK